MKVKLTKSGIFTESGQVLDVPPSRAQQLVREKRAELVPDSHRAEKMVPQRSPERMKRKG
jgi:hypothetical protein